MTYNNMNGFPAGNGLGMPGAGFAARGKNNRPQRLSLASPPKVGSISENPNDGIPNPPRTSRSHLLAGLRTQPRTPGPVPASAPYNKTSHGHQAYGMATPQYQQNNVGYGNVPHTAIGSNFPSLGRQQQQFSLNPGQQLYGLPEQAMAPPQLDIDESEEQIDPQFAAQLMATQMYLQERQQQLQNMIFAQQMAGLTMNGNKAQSSYPQTPVTPQQVNMYPQAQLNGNATVTQEVPGQPGMYVVYNMLTGQSTLAVDPTYQQQQQGDLANSPPPPTPSHINTKFHGDRSTPYDTGSPFGSRSRSPPKKSSSPPVDVTPLPPPSANAFRRGHNRNRSSLALNPANGASVGDGPKSAFIRPVGMPATPMTGTFGPGHGRAGEHPMRQPMGPPSFDDLKKAPTSKHEGSKNFATRQRRKALNTLVRAGLERRVRPGSGTAGSAGSVTPVSETELTFSVPSDNDSDSGRSLSGRLSMGSLRAAASGAIGSERKRNLSKENLHSGSVTPSESRSSSANFLVGLGAA
ncbi:hypothetical protein BT63DRAFT_241142 [Microthyrium microscopicum]|uniref:Uncharacterized protein n=1 Tax=Microthyrium microscopicum TaxID=703497 RepID=A0A6A6UEF8_9PEZI|nr:hypothetical protein BT63DRAFT_241142 [Microthyrium microscopicum]